MTLEERREYNRRYQQLRAQRLAKKEMTDAELLRLSENTIDKLSALGSRYSYSAADLRTYINIIVKAYRLDVQKIKEDRP